jgi:adenine-specific DNA methylase
MNYLCYPNVIPILKGIALKISVETNKNVIFFETLLSLLEREESGYHVLGEKILKEYDFIKKFKSYENFKKKYQEGKIPDFRYHYLILSINLNEDLTTKEQAPRDGFGPKREGFYKENIYPLVKDIYEESKFEKVYESKIISDYEKVAKDIQKLFDNQKPDEVLMDLWKGEYKPKLVFIPDPLRVGGGSSVSRNGTFYSITGTLQIGEEVVFNPSYIISNLLHEYSHTFFKHYLYSNEEMLAKNKKLTEELSKKIEDKIGETTLGHYGSSSVYFEESFMRAIQILLSKRFFEKYTSKEEMEKKAIEQLQKRKEEGFIYVDDFYNQLEEGSDPMASYMKVLESL